MNTRISIAVAALATALLGTGAAYAQAPPVKPTDCPKGAPERVEGQVVKVDQANHMVTIRSADGTTHEFQASQETLKDLKVGEKLSAKLRVGANCK